MNCLIQGLKFTCPWTTKVWKSTFSLLTCNCHELVEMGILENCQVCKLNLKCKCKYNSRNSIINKTTQKISSMNFFFIKNQAVSKIKKNVKFVIIISITHWLFTIQFLPETYRNKIAFSIQTNFRSDKKIYRILKCHHFQKYEK